ncbi:MAG: hypothetical protein ACYSWU_28420 [Planctomycetota bacterium]|jgi:hypothetical protein
MDREKLDAKLRGILDQVRQRIVAEASPSLQDLASMEDVICEGLNQSKAQALQAWCEETKDDSASPPCPHCGGVMRNKGRRSKTVIAEGGPVEFKRTRWWCDACKASFSPSG